MSAPTGSGKTTILELAIVELLTYLERISYNIDGNANKIKIIYGSLLGNHLYQFQCVESVYLSPSVAPTRALCNEIYVNWERKFKCVHLKCVLVTGNTDTEFMDLDDITGYHIIVTTPEKWYAMTRSWRDHKEIAETIKLVLIDEVHLLGDESRGSTLEAIVSRMKSFTDRSAHGDDKFRERALRFVAVSGTIPNINDLAEWIKADSRVDCTKFQYAKGIDIPITSLTISFVELQKTNGRSNWNVWCMVFRVEIIRLNLMHRCHTNCRRLFKSMIAENQF